MNEGEEGNIRFIITCEDSSEPLEFLEKAFNQMTFFIGVPIHRAWLADIAFGRNCTGGVL